MLVLSKFALFYLIGLGVVWAIFYAKTRALGYRLYGIVDHYGRMTAATLVVSAPRGALFRDLNLSDPYFNKAVTEKLQQVIEGVVYRDTDFWAKWACKFRVQQPLLTWPPTLEVEMDTIEVWLLMLWLALVWPIVVAMALLYPWFAVHPSFNITLQRSKRGSYGNWL